MTHIDEIRHVARRLTEQHDGVDLPPYDEADPGEQNWIDSHRCEAAKFIAAFNAIAEYRARQASW